MKFNFVKLVESVLSEHVSRGAPLPFDVTVEKSTGLPKEELFFTKKFNKELKGFAPQNKAEIQRFIDEYLKSSGNSPAKFEYKFKATQRIDTDLRDKFGERTPIRFNIYTVQIRHVKPSIHLLVAEGRPLNGRRIIAFLRAFNDYNEYSRMLDIFRKSSI